jgi:hypothetical protein
MRQFWLEHPNGNETVQDFPRASKNVAVDELIFDSPALLRAPRIRLGADQVMLSLAAGDSFDSPFAPDLKCFERPEIDAIRAAGCMRRADPQKALHSPPFHDPREGFAPDPDFGLRNIALLASFTKGLCPL